MEAASMEPVRYFTVEEANALLPQLRLALAQVQEARQQMVRSNRTLEEIERQRDRSNTLQLGRPLREAREKYGNDREALRLAVESITMQGVQIKSLTPALLDFPSWRDGQVVLLCWTENEAEVGYWHERDSGFAGRRPL